MGGGEGGPYKQVGAEQASSEDLLDGDRELIDEQISRSVIQLFMDLNASPMAAMGLGAAQCPRFRSRGVTSEDPEKIGRVLEAAQRLGVKIGAAEAHRRLGIKRPAKGEDILEAPKAESSSIFGGSHSRPDVGGEKSRSECVRGRAASEARGRQFHERALLTPLWPIGLSGEVA
jgi:phage gp29-like protein